MTSYGKPVFPQYQRPFQEQSWEQQQTTSYGQTGTSYYGQSTPSFYGQQETQYYGPAPSPFGQQPSAYSPYRQTYSPYEETSNGQPSRLHFPPGTESKIERVFEMADLDRSGTIDGKELGRVLSTEYGTFSPRTVRLMLHLYADDRNDITCIGPAGFVQLWRDIKQWQIVFERFDRDRSGTIEMNELREALLSLRLNIPPQVLHELVSTFDITGQGKSIEYENFIECGLIVKVASLKMQAAAELSPVKSELYVAHESHVAILSSFVLSFKLVQDGEPCDTADSNSWKMQGLDKRRCFMDLLGVEEEAAS